MICSLCKFPYELDDQAAPRICLRCFAYNTGTTKQMRRLLRRELTAALDEIVEKTYEPNRFFV